MAKLSGKVARTTGAGGTARKRHGWLAAVPASKEQGC
jgi:hypothetical protein